MISRKQLIWLAALAIGDLVLAIVAWQTLPNRMRVPWDVDGNYRIFDPWEAGGLYFTIGWIVFLGLLLLAGRSDPAFQRSDPIIGRGTTAICAFVVGNHLMLILCCVGLPINFLPASAGSAGLLEAALGNWMPKFRRDDRTRSFYSFQTSWMLKDDAVWERTNRIGWRIVVAHGLAVFLAGCFFSFGEVFVFLYVGFLAIKFWSHVYSLWLYKKLHPGEWPN